LTNKPLLARGMTLMLLLPLLSTLIAATACAAEKPVIVCTTSAVGSVVEELLGDTAETLVLVQPGLCPADFDMKPGYIEAVAKAQILFKQNIQGEFWLDGLLEAAGNPGLTMVAIPGVYNTPEGARSYVRRIGGNLSQILHVDLESKISEMLQEINEVSDLMASRASALGASDVKVICMAWLQTFVESAGFTVVAAYNPPETLSASDIASLLQTAQSESVALIADNLQIDTEFGAGIAIQAGAEHVVLTNFPGAIPGTETLPKMLRYNAEQLFNGTILWRSTSTLRAERLDLQNQVAIFQVVASLAVVVALAEAVLLYAKRKRGS
jgi:hypothetical protein